MKKKVASLFVTAVLVAPSAFSAFWQGKLPNVPLNDFKISSITASPESKSSSLKEFIFQWSNPTEWSNPTVKGDISYTVCKKNIEMNDFCEKMAEVENSTSVKVSVDNLLFLSSEEFFIIADNGFGTKSTPVMKIAPEEIKSAAVNFTIPDYDISDWDLFGGSGVINKDMDRVFIGNPDHDDSSYPEGFRGAVLDFRLENGIWGIKKNIISDNLSDKSFGQAIALSSDENYLIVSDNTYNRVTNLPTKLHVLDLNSETESGYTEAGSIIADDKDESTGGWIHMSSNSNLLLSTAHFKESFYSLELVNGTLINSLEHRAKDGTDNDNFGARITSDPAGEIFIGASITMNYANLKTYGNIHIFKRDESGIREIQKIESPYSDYEIQAVRFISFAKQGRFLIYGSDIALFVYEKQSDGTYKKLSETDYSNNKLYHRSAVSSSGNYIAFSQQDHVVKIAKVSDDGEVQVVSSISYKASPRFMQLQGDDDNLKLLIGSTDVGNQQVHLF